MSYYFKIAPSCEDRPHGNLDKYVSNRKRLKASVSSFLIHPSSFLLSPSLPLLQFGADFGGVGVFDGIDDVECRFGAGNGLGVVVQCIQKERGVEHRDAFASPVADFTSNGQLGFGAIRNVWQGNDFS